MNTTARVNGLRELITFLNEVKEPNKWIPVNQIEELDGSKPIVLELRIT